MKRLVTIRFVGLVEWARIVGQLAADGRASCLRAATDRVIAAPETANAEATALVGFGVSDELGALRSVAGLCLPPIE